MASGEVYASFIIQARFSADLDRGFAQLGAALKPLFARRPRGAAKAAPVRPAS